MSYSFTVRGSNKADAKAKVAAELDKVVASQASHAADKPAAQIVADSFIDLLRTDETQDVLVAMNGSLWTTAEGLNQASVNVNASVGPKIKV